MLILFYFNARGWYLFVRIYEVFYCVHMYILMCIYDNCFDIGPIIYICLASDASINSLHLAMLLGLIHHIFIYGPMSKA